MASGTRGSARRGAHTLIVAAPAGTDVAEALDALVGEGRMSSFAPDALGSSLRSSDREPPDAPGRPEQSVPLALLDASRAAYDEQASRRMWGGAVLRDGSVSDLTLSLMRFDEAASAAYAGMYGDEEGYVSATCCPHADAWLELPGGMWADCLSMRSPGRVAGWHRSFFGRFVGPLLAGGGGEGVTLSAWVFSR